MLSAGFQRDVDHPSLDCRKALLIQPFAGTVEYLELIAPEINPNVVFTRDEIQETQFGSPMNRKTVRFVQKNKLKPDPKSVN